MVGFSDGLMAIMKEFDFIRRYLSHEQHDADVLLGIGDDAAVIRPRLGYDLCFSSDMLLNNRHFFEDVAPDDLAHKVLAVNLSDMAAMGAVPRWALLSAGLPQLQEDWLAGFCGSLFALAQQFGVTLVGGDTTKGDLAFNVTIIGELPLGKALRRSGAQVGDDIWVSGCLGLAAAALACHQQRLVLPEAVFAPCEQARLRPEPRVALGRALLPFAHAAQDVSDGLAQDLGHILQASGVGAEVYADDLPTLPQLRAISDKAALYQFVLAGGDDYELVFTAPESCRHAVLEAGRMSSTPVTRIGRITAGAQLHIADASGRTVSLASLGFDHFG